MRRKGEGVGRGETRGGRMGGRKGNRRERGSRPEEEGALLSTRREGRKKDGERGKVREG